jgi:hypothetical protein
VTADQFADLVENGWLVGVAHGVEPRCGARILYGWGGGARINGKGWKKSGIVKVFRSFFGSGKLRTSGGKC